MSVKTLNKCFSSFAYFAKGFRVLSSKFSTNKMPGHSSTGELSAKQFFSLTKYSPKQKMCPIEAGLRFVRDDTSLSQATLGKIRDAQLLSKHLFAPVEEWMLRGKCWSVILENGIQFTKVRLSPNFGSLKIFWAPTGIDHVDKFIQKSLESLAAVDLREKLRSFFGDDFEIKFRPDYGNAKRNIGVIKEDREEFRNWGLNDRNCSRDALFGKHEIVESSNDYWIREKIERLDYEKIVNKVLHDSRRRTSDVWSLRQIYLEDCLGGVSNDINTNDDYVTTEIVRESSDFEAVFKIRF